jgi:hypothetical protein
MGWIMPSRKIMRSGYAVNINAGLKFDDRTEREEFTHGKEKGRR